MSNQIATFKFEADLLFLSDSIQAMVHNFNPAVLGRQHKQRHQSLTKVVEVVPTQSKPKLIAIRLRLSGSGRAHWQSLTNLYGRFSDFRKTPC